MAAFLSETSIAWAGGGGGNVVETDIVTDVDVDLRSWLTGGTGARVRVPEEERYGGQRVQVGDPIPERAVYTLVLAVTYTGASTDAAVVQRAMADAQTALNARYNPAESDGALQALTVTRKDASNATVTRTAQARVLTNPALQIVHAGEVPDGVYPGGWGFYTVVFDVPSGLWVDGGAQTVQASATTGGGSFSCTNNGQWPVSARVAVDTIDSGTPTELTVAQGATTLATISSTGNLAASDFADFGYTVEGKLDTDSDITVAALDWVEIAVGSPTTLTLTTDTGTLTATVTFKRRFGSW